MMVSTIDKRPALGQAWSGDWQARIRDRLRERGFQSVTSFAESRPTVSLVGLAEELSTDHRAGIDHADVAGEQLLRLWRDEAQREGPEAVERFSRRLLVGELHLHLPDGWRADWNKSDPESTARRPALSRLVSATTTWTCGLADEHQPATDRVYDALLADGRAGKIPPGWLPANADDPLLVEIFRQHWPEPG